MKTQHDPRRRARVPMIGLITLILAAALTDPAGARRPASSDAVALWNAHAGRAAVAACISPASDPLHESRLYAMTQLAIHDTLNAIDRRYEPYAFHGRVPRATSLDAAVAAAARGVMVPVLEQARLLGLLNVALADGYVGSFATKYQDRFWRPVTAIHAAATDGNPDTDPDPAWTPLEPTPPIPDHDSAHAVEGSAAATVMKHVFGTDHVAFSVCSSTLAPGLNCDEGAPRFRRFASFSEAAEENGVSRILVGFHFRKAVEDGITHGRRIAGRAVDRFMRPVR